MARRTLGRAFLFLAALIVSSCASPSYWWTYQGDSMRTGGGHGGIGRSPMLRWDVTLGGGSNLTAPVFGAIGDTFRLFIGSGYGDRTLYALHPQTGATLWTYTAPANNGFGGAAAAINGLVYAATQGSSPEAYALDQATGAVLWHTALPSTGSRAAVAVAGNRVIVNTDAHQVVSLDAGTGAMQWSATTSPGTSSQQSSPAVFDKVYVGSGDKLYAFVTATGALAWSYQLPTPPGAPAPVIGFSSPVVSIASATPLVLISATDWKVHAVNATTGAPVWTYTSNASLADTSVALADGKVFTRGLTGATALDVNTGAVLWTQPIGLPTKTAVVGGRTVYYSDGQSLVALDAAGGAFLWKAPVPGAGNVAGADMAMALEILVVPNRGHVYAFK